MLVVLGNRTSIRVRGGLDPRLWWYIPEWRIYHQLKLAQPGPCRTGISSASGDGSATRLRIPDV
jgi:hypothetical protein